MQTLHRLLPDKTWVTRSGQSLEVAWGDIVPGDVLILNVFACRSDRLSVTRSSWFSNPLILWGITIKLPLLAVITYTPIGHEIFGTSPLPAWIFGPLALGALMLLFAKEARKIIVRRMHHRQHHGNAQRASAA